MDNKNKEILPLTSVRFLTSLYVFLFHLQLYWHIGKVGSLASFLGKGACGMSTFFILSGFVLSFRFHLGITNLRQYAFQRFSRIYPVYCIAALVTLPWLLLSLGPHQDLLGVQATFIIVVNVLMLQAWMPQLVPFWNDGGSWSLSVEMFFYALFPFLVNAIKNINTRAIAIFLLFLYLFSAMPGLSWLLFKNIDPSIFYFVPIFRLAEFMIGMLCGLLYARGLRIYKPTFSTVLFTTLLAFYLLKGPDLEYIIVAHQYVTVPLIALVLYSVASLSQGLLYRFMTNRLFLYFGRISYSFYSFQALLLLVFVPQYPRMVSMFPIFTNPYVLSITMFLLLIAIASLSYHVIENTFRRYLQEKFTKGMDLHPVLKPIDIGLKGSLQ